jgi:hypothetical protein
LFNVPVIAYSGELDRQIQAAQVMEEAFIAEGRKLEHLIGPNVEHKYEPQTLKVLLERLDQIAQQGRPDLPHQVSLQTRTLRYASQAWVSVESLQRHWDDSRVDAKIIADKRLQVATRNINRIRLHPWADMIGAELEIDGQPLTIRKGAPWHGGKTTALLERQDNQWTESIREDSGLRKRPFLQGPIDDAFMGPRGFVVVRPRSATSGNQFEAWCVQEFEHFVSRWRALMRGEPIIVEDDDAVERHAQSGHVVVFGNPGSNKFLAKHRNKLPIVWTDGSWEFGGKRYESARFAPAFVFPNPANRVHYVVVNSGITFREGHDSTNSNQTPKLPDWAVIDLTQAPDSLSPGKIVDAGFFDEQWRIQ